MDFTKYDFFYLNGCSHVEGGGLEEPSLKNDSVLPYYIENYNVSWNNRTEVNFGKRLEELTKVKCVNEAICGGGPERTIRMTYEFIHNNWNNRDKFFIILEKPDSSRFELFFNEEYYIGNSSHIMNTNKTKFAFTTRNYFDKSKYKEDKEKQDIFLDYHDKFFSHTENVKKMDFAYAGLYSFCKMNNIKIYLMMQNDYFFNTCFDRRDIIQFENGELSDILTFCKKNKLTITDETKNTHNDFHPGYFGHIEYAKELYKFLKNE
jgi:hypothetical protein